MTDILTEEMEDEIEQEILDVMTAREETGVLISEADFLAGAMAVMGIVSGAKEEGEVWQRGHGWIFLVIGGRSLVASRLKKSGKEQEAKMVQDRQDVMMRRIHHARTMVQILKAVLDEGISAYLQDISWLLEEMQELDGFEYDA